MLLCSRSPRETRKIEVLPLLMFMFQRDGSWALEKVISWAVKLKRLLKKTTYISKEHQKDLGGHIF